MPDKPSTRRDDHLHRRSFLKSAGIATATTALGMASAWHLAYGAALTKAQREKLTPDDIIDLMKKGNQRFRLGKESPHDYLAQQKASAKGQYPAAIILSCIDSRAPAETIMDLGIGDCFNARVAGNIANDDILGSMEFACKVAGAKVVLVMGHTACGAIKGAIDRVQLGNLTGLLAKIQSAVDATSYQGERSAKNYGFVDAVARKNVELTMAEIRSRSAVIAELETIGAVKIAGAMYNLFEGNNGSGYWGDVFHGTSGLNTVFRNRAVGWETGKTAVTVPVQLESYNRFDNIIGNVLGQFGYHTTYQTSLGVAASASIYDLGAGNTEGLVTVLSDSLVASTLMRWGNYDVVNAAVRFVNSEVPSGISSYANPVPASQTLPPSFYLSAKPSWWPSGKVWPPIGPDVTGGNIPNLAGHAYTIPAQDCYANVMGGPSDGSGTILTFNANTCYAIARPAPPTNLTVVVK